jgi:outer membrane protein assembly factor BamB/predicted Ser/Thr protein kinase
MPDHSPLRPGDPRRLAGYRLIGLLGEGGQGAVYLGEGPDGGPVAIKLLHARKVGDARARTRFAREVSAARRVGEFCTARVLAADLDGDIPYLVSEYIDGPSLHDAVLLGGPLRDADLHRLAVGMATALAAIHRAGIVHRDFKPANVLLSSRGPKVVDFGIARALDTASTLTSQVIGTPAYMAPEQLGTGAVGPAADVFAWACTLAFAATGNPPFGNDSVPAVIKRIIRDQPDLGGLTGPLAETTAMCLAKDPAARPTAERLLVRLLGGPDTDVAATLAAGSQVAAALRTRPVPSPATRPETPGRRPARRRVLAGAGVLAAAVASGGVALASETFGDRRMLWRHTIPGAKLYTAAAAANTVFVTDINRLRLVALAAGTGRQRWAWNWQTQFIAASGPTLYVADLGNVYAVDAATGRRKWLSETKVEQFAIGGDVVVCATYGTRGTVLYGLGTADGRRRWTHTIAVPNSDLAPKPDTLAVTSTLAVIAGRTTLYALSTANGAELWRFPITGSFPSPPVVVGDTVYLGVADSFSGTLWALEAASGRIRWKWTGGPTAFSKPMADLHAVYVEGSRGNGLHALDARSGRELWYYAPGMTPHVAFGDTIYGEISDGIGALDPTTGRVRWRYSRTGKDKAALTYRAASGTAVFATTGASDLVALRAH